MTSHINAALFTFLLASTTLVSAASSDFQYPYTSSTSFNETLIANSTCAGVYEGANTAFACQCVTDETTSAFSLCAPATPDLISAFCSGETEKGECYTDACPSGTCAPLPITGSTVLATDCETGTSLGYTQTGKCGCFAISNSTTSFTACTVSSTTESAVCVSESLTASDGVQGGFAAFCDSRTVVAEAASLVLPSDVATSTSSASTSATEAIPTVFTVIDGTLAIVTGAETSTTSDSVTSTETATAIATSTSSDVDTDAVESAIATQAVPSAYTVVNGTLAIASGIDLATSTSSAATAVRTDYTLVDGTLEIASATGRRSASLAASSSHHLSRTPIALSSSTHLSRSALSSSHLSRTPLSYSSGHKSSRHPSGLIRSSKTRSPTSAVRTAYPLSIIQDPTGTEATPSFPTGAATPNVTVVTGTRTQTILDVITSTDTAETKTITDYKLSPSQCIKYTYIFPAACCPTAALGLTKRGTHARRFGSEGHGKMNVVVTEYIPTETTATITTTVAASTSTVVSYLNPMPSGCLSSTLLDLKSCPSTEAQARAVSSIKKSKRSSKNKVTIDCGSAGTYEY